MAGVIARGQFFNATRTTAQDLVTEFTPERAAALRVSIILDAAGAADATLICRITDENGTTVTGIFNDATALTRGNAYTFVIGCHPDYTYGFRVGTNTTVAYFQVDEVVGRVI